MHARPFPICPRRWPRLASFAATLVLLLSAAVVSAQPAPAPPPPLPVTPLAPDVLSLLANEVSGQIAFNNEVLLAGAPRLRQASELTGTMFETQALYDLVRSYGIETTRIERSPSRRTFDYPVEGELWVMEPGKRLVARLAADAALVAGGSSSVDLTAPLAYVPPLSPEEVRKLAAGGPQERYKGKVALMWSHPREEAAKALDAAGLAGVISFSSRDRYFDPHQVIYGGGSYKHPNLRVGLNVSWRQWSEMLEDVLSGRTVTVRVHTKVETHPDRFEAVYSWIPGTEPDARGVIFTAHLFEGYVKRGANDDMSGVVVQLEILRALNRLIAGGQLPRPRRTIYFLWPNEISGTFDFIKRHPGIADRWSININMDMVGEGLRKNNAVMTMSECPDHLPSYLDGLMQSVMNYVWRTNDIVYLPDSPRGRQGGQYFPQPMTEKNGSEDAFRFFIHRATGGSDHICFNNPAVAVPGIELFTWPDQWYHADTDTPDKSDPTQMKRIAFIGAAAAWAAADCSDPVLRGLLDAVSAFGYRRIAERDLAKALGLVEQADLAGLGAAAARALNLVEWAVDREVGALRSTEDVFTGSPAARSALDARVRQWELYRAGLRSQVEGYARVRAAALAPAAKGQQAGRAVAGLVPGPGTRGATGRAGVSAGRAALVPSIAEGVKGREFQLGSYEPYARHLEANPEALKTIGLTPALASAILNYVNGRRTVAVIRNAVAAETGQEPTLESVAGYLDLLASLKVVTYSR